MRDLAHVEHRVVVLQRVVAVVIAEWTFGTTQPRRDLPHQGELGARNQRMRMPVGPRHLRQALARDQRCQHEFWHVLGQRRDGRENQRRRAAQEHGDGQRLVARLGAGIVKAAALANLPVHAGRVLVVHLHAIHAEVMTRLLGMLGVDKWERDKRAAVIGPTGDDRQLIEAHVRRDHFSNGAGRQAFRADLEQVEANVARAPQLGGRWRQHRFRQVDDALDEVQRPLAERQLRTPGRAEQVGHQRESRALDVGEQ